MTNKDIYEVWSVFYFSLKCDNMSRLAWTKQREICDKFFDISNVILRLTHDLFEGKLFREVKYILFHF